MIIAYIAQLLTDRHNEQVRRCLTNSTRPHITRHIYLAVSITSLCCLVFNPSRRCPGAVYVLKNSLR